MTVTAPPTAPTRPQPQSDPEALIEEARARQRRRRIRFGLLGLVAAAAAGVAAWIATGGSAPLTVGVIRAREAVALNHASQSMVLIEREGGRHLPGVLHAVVNLATGQQTTVYHYTVPGLSERFGDTTTYSSYAKTGDSPYYLAAEYVVVNAQQHTRKALSTDTAITKLTPSTLCQCDPFAPNGGTPLAGVTLGDRHITILGEDTINGQQAIQLRFTWLNAFLSSHVWLDFWISPSTWLPIRERGNMLTLSGLPNNGTPPVGSAYTLNFTWLPRIHRT